jgi:hypothetical protein
MLKKSEAAIATKEKNRGVIFEAFVFISTSKSNPLIRYSEPIKNIKPTPSGRFHR